MLTIKDLTVSKELDRNAMAAVSGGNAALISEMTRLANGFSTQNASGLAASGDKAVDQNMLSVNTIGPNYGGISYISDNDTQSSTIKDEVYSYAFNEAMQRIGG